MGGGVGRCTSPPPHNPNWKRFLYIHNTHCLPLIFVEKNFSFEVARPKKASKFDLFQRFKNQNLHFWISFQKFIFLSYFDTHQSIFEFFFFILFLWRSQKCFLLFCITLSISLTNVFKLFLFVSLFFHQFVYLLHSNDKSVLSSVKQDK